MIDKYKVAELAARAAKAYALGADWMKESDFLSCHEPEDAEYLESATPKIVGELCKFYLERNPMQTQKPSPGRIVLYHRYGTPGGEHLPEPSPAIVTKVLDADTQRCQLFVMNPNGLYFNDTPFSQEPKPGHWSWPPRV